MENDIKNWVIVYEHKDGRYGKVKVTTEVADLGAFEHGNGKAGSLTVDGYQQIYDLRYCHDKDLHLTMLKEYFGDDIVFFY